MLLYWCRMTTELTVSWRSTKFLKRAVRLDAERDKMRWPPDGHPEQRPPHSMKSISLCLLIMVSGITLQAKLVTKTVSYEQNGTKLEGYLAYDDSITDKGKVPGIVVFPEWWGLNDYVKGRAEQLAGLGVVAFGADLY